MIGTRMGPYEVLAKIGEGGMGEVYRATDTTLKRGVAIKVLPAALASDAERLARFQREAEVLAALNHPHIAHVYGLERSGGTPALVMELVEGSTLADRVARGPIPMDEALSIARQMAEALEAAHEQGIVHRDLKPANIKVREDGTVKVLDFGLAKLARPAAAAAPGGLGPHDPSQSPTITSPAMTAAGVILGTAAYMSPEQAKGREADKRSDIWAFGCVLYEMLTGSRAFEGDDVSDTLAAVLRAEPDWTKLPRQLPPPVAAMLRRCLQKDRRERIGDVAAILFVLREAALAAGTPVPGVTARRFTRRMRFVPAAVAIAGLGAALAALLAWNAREAAPQADVARVAIPVSPALEIPKELSFPNARPHRATFAWSTEGRYLVFVGKPESGAAARNREPSQLYRRDLDQWDATPLPGTQGATSPFLSPSGEWVGFWVGDISPGGGGELRKLPIRGGPVETIAKLALPAGISWGDDGHIVFATNSGEGLWRVSENGGSMTELTTVDANRGESRHLLPHVLPGGRTVLFTVQKALNTWDDTEVVALSLDNGERRVLVEQGATDARYVAPGYLVYARLGTLTARRFDPETLQLSGTPVALFDGVMHDVGSAFGIGNTGTAQFAVSSAGTLAYLPGGVAPEGTYRPIWVDRNGAETGTGAGPRSYGLLPRLSPNNGTRALFPLRAGVGILDLARGGFQLHTPQDWGPPEFRWSPALRAAEWHPDGKRVAFTGMGGNLVLASLDASGTVEPLTRRDSRRPLLRDAEVPLSWSPDERTLLFGTRSGSGTRDIRALTIGAASPSAAAVVTTPADEPSAEFSPDGRFVAYASDRSGSLEVYVQAYPEPGEITQVSTAGGSQPMWSRDGRELFYVEPGSQETFRMMSVGVTLGETFTAGRPRPLFEKPSIRFPGGGSGRRAYDVAEDGRFLMVAQENDNAQPPIDEILLVQGWVQELAQRVRSR